MQAEEEKRVKDCLSAGKPWMEHKGSQMRKIAAQKNGWESYVATAHLRNDFPLKRG